MVLENLVKNDITKVDDSFQASAPALNYVARIFSGTVSSSLIFSICALLFANIYSFEKRKNHINFFNVVPSRLGSSFLAKVSTATAFVTLSLVISTDYRLFDQCFSERDRRFPLPHCLFPKWRRRFFHVGNCIQQQILAVILVVYPFPVVP